MSGDQGHLAWMEGFVLLQLFLIPLSAAQDLESTPLNRLELEGGSQDEDIRAAGFTNQAPSEGPGGASQLGRALGPLTET